MTDLDDLAQLREVTLDIGTLTLGEAAEAERQSGMRIEDIARSTAAMRMLAIFVYLLRSSAKEPRWSDLAALRLVDVSRSTSQRSRDGRSSKSSDSRSRTSRTSSAS